MELESTTKKKTCPSLWDTLPHDISFLITRSVYKEMFDKCVAELNRLGDSLPWNYDLFMQEIVESRTILWHNLYIVELMLECRQVIRLSELAGLEPCLMVGEFFSWTELPLQQSLTQLQSNIPFFSSANFYNGKILP